MGALKLRVQFTGIPNTGEPFTLRVKYDSVVVFNNNFTWGAGVGQIPIGVSANINAANLKTVLDSEIVLQNTQSVVTEVITDSLYITIGTNIIDTIGEFLYSSSWITSGAYQTYGFLYSEPYEYPAPDPIILDEEIILSRSPYSFKASPGVAYDNITASIYIYTGHKVDDIPLVETFNLSKSVVQAGQLSILFNISALVNDYVKNNLNVIPSAGAFTISDSDSVWCYINASVNLGDVSVYTIQQTVLAVDGFGWHTELANPTINQNILTTETKRSVVTDELSRSPSREEFTK